MCANLYLILVFGTFIHLHLKTPRGRFDYFKEEKKTVGAKNRGDSFDLKTTIKRQFGLANLKLEGTEKKVCTHGEVVN